MSFQEIADDLPNPMYGSPLSTTADAIVEDAPENVMETLGNLSVIGEEVNQENLNALIKANDFVSKTLTETDAKYQGVLKELQKIREAMSAANNHYDEQVQEIIKMLKAELQEKLNALSGDLQGTDVERATLYKRVEYLKKLVAQLQKYITDMRSKLASKEGLEELQKQLEEEFKNTRWWKAAKDYQKEDILFEAYAFLSNENGVLNANVMGSGKTLEKAAFIDISRWLFAKRYANLGRTPRILWITKVSLLGSSHAELSKWSDHRYMYIQGTHSERVMKLNLGLDADAAILINYDMLNSTPEIINVEWDVIFIDEVHQLKGGANPSGPTARFVNTRKLLGIEAPNSYQAYRTRTTTMANGELTKQLPFVSMLSATPVQNRPEEVWCYLHLFDPQLFPNLKQFMRNFVDYYGGFSPAKMLKTLQGRFIRQDPELIYSQRPDKDHLFVEVEMTANQRKVFEKALDYVLNDFDTEDGSKKAVNITAVIAKLTRCRQISLWPASVETEFGRINVEESGKIEAAMEILEQLLSENEQCVVWTSQFNAPLEVLYERISALGKSCAYMTGSTKNPGEVEKAFQQGEIDVILCNMKAAGEGYNFNKNPEEWPGGASNAIFLDMWYNPQVNIQAEDRIWRTGAVSGVKIWILHDPNSIDSLIAEICAEKQEMFDSVVERKELKPSEWNWKNKLEALKLN